MADDLHHEHLIREVTELFYPLFLNSPQGIYIYLDDTHKSCSQMFSEMLGYSSPQEWIENESPISDIVQEDQDEVIEAYQEASEELQATNVQARWTTQQGKKIVTDIIMTPFIYREEVFIIHYVTLLQN